MLPYEAQSIPSIGRCLLILFTFINLLNMPTYYTEYPTGEFYADNDDEALLLEPDAKVIYKESNSPNGLPLIFLRNTHAKDDI